MNHYRYFGKSPAGVLQANALFEIVAEQDPTSAQMNTIYQQLVKQRGLGTARPTHYTVQELFEIDYTDDEVENVTLIRAMPGR